MNGVDEALRCLDCGKKLPPVSKERTRSRDRKYRPAPTVFCGTCDPTFGQ